MLDLQVAREKLVEHMKQQQLSVPNPPVHRLEADLWK